MAPDAERRNNFDLVRLFAASQVLWMHATRHMSLSLHAPLDALDSALRMFPGVPAFFVVSGFLITDAWLRVPSASIYARNRALRVYPALWAALALAVGLAAGFGHGPRMLENPGVFLLWLAGQVSVVQVWNPDFLRGFGVGVLNGSLWTIPVELQFYAALPLLLRLPRAAMGASLLGSAFLYALVEGARPLPLVNRVLLVTLAPHLFCFGLGVLARLYQAHIRVWWAGRFPLWLAAHVLAQLALPDAPWAEAASRPLLAMVVLSAAFSAPGLAAAGLRGHDISYGLYLVHMPLINAAVEAGLTGRWRFGLGVAAACYALALLSWLAIERPALRLKRRRPAPAAPQPARPG